MPWDTLFGMADVDPRVELAAERTMLAWVRTGLSMMGFGFVVARFGLFLRELATTHGSATSSHGLSLWAGVALVALGVATLVVAPVRHARLLHRLRSGETAGITARPGMALAFSLATVGAATAIYLVVTSH